jgi:hypothetical protein
VPFWPVEAQAGWPRLPPIPATYARESLVSSIMPWGGQLNAATRKRQGLVVSRAPNFEATIIRSLPSTALCAVHDDLLIAFENQQREILEAHHSNAPQHERRAAVIKASQALQIT